MSGIDIHYSECPKFIEETYPPAHSVHSEWTIPWLAERWRPVRQDTAAETWRINSALDLQAASSDLSYAWKDGIGKRWLPESSANLIDPHDFSIDTGTKAYICTALFDDAGMVAEDVERLLDDHGLSRSWQQWKVVNQVVSLIFVSTVAYSLALSRWQGREAPFPLGNFIPRSILCPFDGTESYDRKHVIVEADGSREHYASHRTTLGFVSASEEMDLKKRWDAGNFSADFIRVAEKVPNVSTIMWMKNEREKDDWIPVKTWKSMPNLYYATAKMERLVSAARAGRVKFVEIDCSRIAKWYVNKYIGRNGICKGKRINARRDFSSCWNKWTGARKTGSGEMPSFKCKTFAQAMKMHSAEIASGEMVYVTHMEKIVRGLFIGNDIGLPLHKLMESRTPSAMRDAMAKRKPPKDRKKIDGTDIIENDVWFDWNFLFDFLERSPRICELTEMQIKQLEKMAEEGWVNSQGIGVYRPAYRKSLHGRYYGFGNKVQMLPKWLRRELFGKYYVEADLGSAVVSILANQAADCGYSGDISELEAMAKDKDAYRASIAVEDCGIGYEKVKKMTTMIGYGCKCNPKRLMSEAEWCSLVEQYDIEETEYDILSTRSRSALFNGIDDPKEKMAIALWADSEKVSAYCGQMHDAGAFVIGKNTFKLDGRNVIENAWGTRLVLPKGQRLSFGKKLAHIYQGAESKLLWTIWDKFEVGGKKLKDIEGGFGLFIHDGFGIRRDIAAKIGDTAKALHDFARREFGWNLEYSCE